MGRSGPYYVRGEFVQSDVREGQLGVPMTLIMQVIDINTCQPAENVYLDIWHANATGYYAGLPKGTLGFLNSDGTSNATYAGTFPSPVSIYQLSLIHTSLPNYYVIWEHAMGSPYIDNSYYFSKCYFYELNIMGMEMVFTEHDISSRTSANRRVW